MPEFILFPSGQVRYMHNSVAGDLWQVYDPQQVVIITDENIEALYPHILGNIRAIVLPVGESVKTMKNAELIIEKLLKMEATRSTVLVGMGGGVITDITGYVASIYMRGIRFGFVPTTLLGMVDAAIGGKNGVNIGLHKNIAGTVTQPDTLLFDTSFLGTLPDTEWSNGFAEIIKYACIFDAALFDELAQHDIAWYRHNEAELRQVIARCVGWKNKTVAEDERETGIRKLLNFGHTAAHAIENLYALPHGQAVAIGMVIASSLSEQLAYVAAGTTDRIKDILQQYALPVTYPFDVPKAIGLLKMDKKRKGETIDYILLNGIGSASIHPISFDMIAHTMTLCIQ